MARKNTLVYPIAAAQSLSSSFVVAPTIVETLDNCSYQIAVTTVDSSGTFAVEASNNYDVNITTNIVTNAGSWDALPLGGTPSITGASDDILINLNQLPFKAIRLRYTSTVAGTGTASITLVAKQIGG